jgi:hypothetical protein
VINPWILPIHEFAVTDYMRVIADLVKKQSIDCDFEPTRSYGIYTDKKQAKIAKESYLKFKEAGIIKSIMEDLE